MELPLYQNSSIIQDYAIPTKKSDLVTNYPKSSNEITIVIFDWDNTLFCTDYLEMHKPDYNSIFKGMSSLEELGYYINDELHYLENV